MKQFNPINKHDARLFAPIYKAIELYIKAIQNVGRFVLEILE
jgi:hypothetical protein